MVHFLKIKVRILWYDCFKDFRFRSMRNKVHFLKIDIGKKVYNGCVKYSPPIEAGASFNPPNLAKDCILRASVSEAMVFL